jgi:hypothetical protein
MGRPQLGLPRLRVWATGIAIGPDHTPSWVTCGRILAGARPWQPCLTGRCDMRIPGKESCMISRKEEDSVVVAVVIVVIPIAIHMPAMLVFIPPSMTGAPAVLPRFV